MLKKTFAAQFSNLVPEIQLGRQRRVDEGHLLLLVEVRPGRVGLKVVGHHPGHPGEDALEVVLRVVDQDGLAQNL